MGSSFESAFQRIQQELDQQLAEFKDCYENMPSDQRDDAKEWLKQLVQLEQLQNPGWGFLPLKIECNRSCYDDEGEPIYEGDFRIKPRIMLKAVEAWEKGGTFTPKPLVNT